MTDFDPVHFRPLRSGLWKGRWSPYAIGIVALAMGLRSTDRVFLRIALYDENQVPFLLSSPDPDADALAAATRRVGVAMACLTKRARLGDLHERMPPPEPSGLGPIACSRWRGEYPARGPSGPSSL